MPPNGLPQGFTLDATEAPDLPEGFTLDAGGPVRPPSPQQAMEAERTRSKRFTDILPELVYDFTLRPFLEAGSVLREGRTLEQATAFEAMTPEQRAAYKESGRGLMSPFSMSREELMPLEAPLAGLSLLSTGGAVGRPRYGIPKTRISLTGRPRPAPPAEEPLGLTDSLLAPPRALLEPEIPRVRAPKPSQVPKIEAPPPEPVLPASQVPLQATISPKPIARPMLEPPPAKPLPVTPEGPLPIKPEAPAAPKLPLKPQVEPEFRKGGSLAQTQEEIAAIGKRADARISAFGKTIKRKLTPEEETLLAEADLESLSPPDKGIVELHAGLPIPESVKKRVREFFKRPAVGAATSRVDDLPPEKLAHFYNTGQTILNRAFPEQKLGDKLITMRNWNDRFTAEYMMGMEKTPLKALNETELTNLMRAAEGRAAPMNARVVQTLQEWKRLTGQDATLLTQKGAQVLKDARYSSTTGTKLQEPTWKPFAPVKDYYFRAIDDRLVVKMLPQDLATAISRANPTMSAPQAAEMAVGMRAQAKGQAIPSTVGEEAARLLRRGQPQSAHLHERTGFIIPDEILQRPNVSMPAYMESMAKEKAALLTYGPKDALMESAIKSGQANPRPDTALGVEFWDQYRGRSLQGPSYQGIDQIQRILGNTATMMFLGGPTAIKQFSQVGLAAARLPTRSLAVGIKETFTKQGRFEARRFGSVVDDLRNDMIAARAQGGPQPAATRLDRLEMLTRQGANKVVNFWRIPKTDAFGRIVTFNGEKHRLLGLQEKALSRDANAIAKLKASGLSATSSLDEISLAAKRVADRVNLRTGPEEMPFILYKPGLTFFRHLNSFNIAITKTIAQDYVAPLVRSVAKGDVVGTAKGLKNVVKLVTAMGVTGEVLGETLRTLAGRQEDRPGGSMTEFADDLVNGRVPASIFLQRLADNLMFSGMFGYLQVIKEGLLASGGPRESVARIGGALVGAGLSNVTEMAAQTANVAAKELTGTQKQKASARMQAARSVARRIPGAGAFVQPLLPASEQSDRRRATAAIIRARRRGDTVETSEWQRWYQERHGKSLSQASLIKAQQEY